LGTQLNWINTPWTGRLAVSARPRGGHWLAGDLKAWREAGATVVLSLLEAHENADLGLEDEPTTTATVGLQFISFPIEDRNVPTSSEATRALLNQLESLLSEGANILIHCRQGIGRSGLIAVATLLCAGVEFDESIGRVSSARGIEIPETQEQLNWLRSFAARH
jgi:protein-tyrosine phosphatase